MIVIDHDRMIAQLLAMLAQLGWHPPLGGDAVDQHARGDILDGDEAGIVGGRDASTAARWAQAAADEGQPIAFKCSGKWVYVTRLLLDRIEGASGLPARRVAETRHRKLIEMRARAQQSASNASQRAAPPGRLCNYASCNAPEPDHSIREPRAIGME
jgi:hypothetical protein